MIITLTNLPKVTELTNTQESALERLLWCFGRGTHVVWMPVQTVEELLTLNCFSKYAERSLLALKKFSIESRNLIESEFSFKAVVDFNEKHKICFERGSLIIGHELLNDEKFLLEPILLAENELDARVFSLVTDSFLTSRKLLNKAFKVSVDPQGGGGSDTIKKFERYRSEKRPFMCVLDSDKKHPKGRLGETAKHFKDLKLGLNENYYLEILDCHEIENIVPTKVLQEIFPAVDLGVMYASENIEKYKPYPDHKNGLTVASARSLDETHQDDFWKEFYGLTDDAIICNALKDILPKFKKYLDSNTPHKAKEKICELKDSSLHQISKIITDFGVGLRRTIP